MTRFTAHKTAVDADHPIELRLLSETDLVKILANSFYSDFDPNNMTFKLPDETAIRDAMVAAQADAVLPPAAHLDEITLYDLGEYFVRNFSARIEALSRVGYWDGVIVTAARLPLEKRAALYSMLWGGIDAFTRLFVDLARALETLGFAQEARAELGALVPRDRSIIDVAILRFLGSAEDRADAISVRPLPGGTAGAALGAAVKLPRATLTAVIAELKIVMTDSPWPFFAHTDLLDFPGARSRLKLTRLPEDPTERTHQVRELLLRGKIAYLFQRFTEERELTAMLLCMPPSVAEVKDLAGMVRSWIELTHGPTPRLRAQVSNALFLILTKFDLEFLEKGGETAELRKSKWDRRLHASLLELYGKDGWPDDWDGKPFGNTLFLRNPGMKQEHLMDYAEIVKEADGSERLVEAGPAVKRRALIDEYQRAFAGSELVHRHFERWQETWAAAFAANDGGVSFLVERLGEVLDPDLKKRQIGERLNEQAEELDGSLRRFYHADDDASRREKEQALMDLRRQLFGAVRLRKFQNFAHLVDCLLVRERDMREIFLNVAALRLVDQPAAAASGSGADPWADDPWAAAPAGDTVPAQPPQAVDRSGVFASQVMNHWTEALRGLSQNVRTMQALGHRAAHSRRSGAGADRRRPPAGRDRDDRTRRARPGAVGERPLGRRRRSRRHHRRIDDQRLHLLSRLRRPAGGQAPGLSGSAEDADAGDLRAAAAGQRDAGVGSAAAGTGAGSVSGLGRRLAPAWARQHQLRRRPGDRRGAEPGAGADPGDDRHRSAGPPGAGRPQLDDPWREGPTAWVRGADGGAGDATGGLSGRPGSDPGQRPRCRRPRQPRGVHLRDARRGGEASRSAAERSGLDDDVRLVPARQPARQRSGAGLRSGAVGNLAPQSARALRAAAARRPRNAARGADDLGGDPAAVARPARLRRTAGSGSEDAAEARARASSGAGCRTKPPRRRGSMPSGSPRRRLPRIGRLGKRPTPPPRRRRPPSSNDGWTRRRKSGGARRQRCWRGPAKRTTPSARRAAPAARCSCWSGSWRCCWPAPVSTPSRTGCWDRPTPPAVVQPEIPTTLEGARQFLAGNPGADESFGQAERFRQAKQLDGAFLLLRNAAGKGSAPAALALGEMYDPATYSPETSALPAPNPAQAAEWYRQAAEGGIAEAQFRLGQLLLSGKTEEPNGPELGIAWLRKAADQGHQGAKDALPK